MNIDEVLLTREEIKALIHKTYTTSIDCDKAMAKAAQLKLLEWLNGYCDNDDHPGYYSDEIRWDCPECMSELESKLKEG